MYGHRWLKIVNRGARLYYSYGSSRKRPPGSVSLQTETPQGTRAAPSDATAMEGSRQLLMVYKRILRNARVFPSKGRDKMVQEIRAEFRLNAKETDQEKVRQFRQAAFKGLQQLQAYTGLEDSDPNWAVKLEDHPLGGLSEERLDAKLLARGAKPELLGRGKKG